MESIETFEVDGLTVEIHYDEDPMSPADWDQLGEMVAFSPLWSDYRFAERESTSAEDKAIGHNAAQNDDVFYPKHSGWELLARYLRLTEGAEAVPFYVADYGSSGMQLYETNGDDRVSGFIVADRAKIIEAYGDDSEASRKMQGWDREIVASFYVDGVLIKHLTARELREDEREGN